MLYLKLLPLCAILLMVPFASGGEPLQISRKQMDAYLENSREQAGDGSDAAWEDRMYGHLQKSHDPGATARALAAEDHLPVSDERSLMSLWVTYSDLEEAADNLKSPGDRSRHLERRKELERRAIQAVRASGHAPLVIEVAVRVVTADNNCALEPFDAITRDAPNFQAAAVAAAVEAGCSQWWLALHGRFPDNKGILMHLSRGSDLDAAEQLAIMEQLRESTLPSREARVVFLLDYVSTLWRNGLVAEGLDIVDKADERDREWMLDDRPLPRITPFEGIPVSSFDWNRGRGFPERQDDFRLDYIAALYLQGRIEDARRAFEMLPYGSQLRPLWNCMERRQRRVAACDDIERKANASRWYLIESALNRSDEDPYLLAEFWLTDFFSGVAFIDDGSALWVEVLRQRFTGDNYRSLRQELADSWRPSSGLHSWIDQNQVARHASLVPMLARFMNDDFQRKALVLENRLQGARAAWNVVPSLEGSVTDPPRLPAGVQELPLPKKFRASRTNRKEVEPEWPNGMARLPYGFHPVRVERGITTSVAVSLSDGGYWVHLSRDGGKSWGTPLYSGLSHRFPYVVPSTSKMAIWSNDAITLEVAVQEIDPTIYCTTIRRRVAHLYLEISVASLESDRDHDGITDLMEERLLLNPDSADSDGDGLDDGKDPIPNVKATPTPRLTDAAINQLLERLLGPSREPLSISRPFQLIQGRPEDFSSLGPTRAMLIYANTDLKRLHRSSPHLNFSRMQTVIFNREADRGFAVLDWQTKLRLLRNGSSWTLETIYDPLLELRQCSNTPGYLEF